MLKLLSAAVLLLNSLTSTQAVVGPQSAYSYSDTATAGPFDWNITLLEENELSIIRPAIDQGIYNMTTTYILDDQNYDIALYKWDGVSMKCEEAPTPQFPIEFCHAENDVMSMINEVDMYFVYNQSLVQSSDIWTSYADKSGGEACFCLKLTNYLDESSDPFFREISFHEVYYKIEVDSLTDFNTTINIFRTGSENFTDFINYEDEIEAYTCDDDCDPINYTYSQGDYVNICVKTEDGSKFAVHSIKDLTVSQEGGFSYPYVTDFIDGPLSSTGCSDSNTTDAVCKSKLQLIALWFEEHVMASTDYVLDVTGTVKLDYIGRRLLEEGKITEQQARKMEESDLGFSLEIEVDTTNESMGASDSVALSSSAATAVMAMIGGAMLALM